MLKLRLREKCRERKWRFSSFESVSARLSDWWGQMKGKSDTDIRTLSLGVSRSLDVANVKGSIVLDGAAWRQLRGSLVGSSNI